MFEASPEPGDFGLVNIKGDIGADIRLGQWLNGDGFNPYEHVFIYLGQNHAGVDQIFEAEPGGARIAPLSQYDGRHILWSTGLVPLTVSERYVIVSLSTKFVGTPYSFYDYLVILLYRIGIRFPFIARRVKDTSHMICSQAVTEIYAAVGITLTNKAPYLVTPGALAKYLIGLQQRIAKLNLPR